MEVWNEQKARAVEPMSLVRWRQRGGVALPAVVQPVLLTQQLRGCGCGCSGSGLQGMKGVLGQLGFIQTELSGLKSVISSAKQMWSDLEAALGIGAGRREADVITPVQNETVNNIIAPVSAYLSSINDGSITPTCVDLKVWQQQVNEAEATWLGFLRNTEWMDGRAATQAEATLAPYFTNAKRDLQKYVNQYCGTFGGGGGGIFTTPTGEINWPVVGVGASILYMLVSMRRRG